MAGAATSIIFVATKQTRVCRDKTHLSFVTKVCLPRQNTCFVRDKSMLATTKLCLSRQNILLSRQAYFCRDKRRILSSSFFKGATIPNLHSVTT